MEDYNGLGVCNFYYNDPDNTDKIELMKLIQHLWDGDWCENR